MEKLITTLVAIVFAWVYGHIKRIQFSHRVDELHVE